MDWITKEIAIGDYFEAQDFELLQRHGIRSILGLTRTLQGVSPTNLGVEFICIIPLFDGPGNDSRWLREAIDSLAELVELAPPVLVHCRAGRSRSPIVVAGYLMRKNDIAMEIAIGLVQAKREIAVASELKLLLADLE